MPSFPLGSLGQHPIIQLINLPRQNVGLFTLRFLRPQTASCQFWLRCAAKCLTPQIWGRNSEFKASWILDLEIRIMDLHKILIRCHQVIITALSTTPHSFSLYPEIQPGTHLIQPSLAFIPLLLQPPVLSPHPVPTWSDAHSEMCPLVPHKSARVL